MHGGSVHEDSLLQKFKHNQRSTGFANKFTNGSSRYKWSCRMFLAYMKHLFLLWSGLFPNRLPPCLVFLWFKYKAIHRSLPFVTCLVGIIGDSFGVWFPNRNGIISSFCVLKCIHLFSYDWKQLFPFTQGSSFFYDFCCHFRNFDHKLFYTSLSLIESMKH